MLYIGCHLSSSKGFYEMGLTALTIGANTFQFFTRNPRGSKAKALDLEDVKCLNELMQKNAFGPIVAHAPYTINPCSADAHTRAFAREAMADDLQRLSHLDNCFYNFHPGSHVGQGIDTGVELIASTLNEILRPEEKTPVLLETMAGKGSEVGSRFEELRAIIDKVTLDERIGVCMDLCHVSDGGYNIIENLDAVLTEFDKIVGIARLRAIHLNDSKNPPASHKDRHERLGDGYLGLETFCKAVNHPALRTLPFLLETPNELDGYAREIKLMKNYVKG